jgi:hypothetical protein
MLSVNLKNPFFIVRRKRIYVVNNELLSGHHIIKLYKQSTMDTICCGIRSDGIKCTNPCKQVGDNTRCKVHYNSVINYGPNTLAIRELGYVNKKEALDFDKNHRTAKEAEVANGANDDALWILEQNYRANVGLMRARHNKSIADLKVRQREEIAATGVDPDAAAKQRREDVRARQHREFIARRALQRAMFRNALNPNPGADAPPPPANPLARFAADPQNVHTTQAVRQTKEIVEHVRKIPVPEGYRWNTSVVSKTIGEIISECQLTSHAAAQMFNQYVSTVAVYDIEEGIYGKVLDSVWQYVKASPDREDLCKILKNEMTDNIGMCAQGNLSRICNILAGYMEGVGSQESLSDRLGRLLPPLMEIEDVGERIRQACVILADNYVPSAEWDDWMEPILEDGFEEFYSLIREQLVPA